MSGPILFFLAVVVIDLVLKSVRGKKRVEEERKRRSSAPTDRPTRKPQVDEKRSGGSLRELKKMLEEEFQNQTGDVKDPESKMDRRFDSTGQPVEKEVLKSQDISRKQTREDLIRRQKDKVEEHSELEKSRRLKKDQMLTRARLSDSQVTLASQHINGRKIDDFDLSTKKPLTIELEEKEKREARAKSKSKLKIKKDIVKAIVYSEIIGKPKSMQK